MKYLHLLVLLCLAACDNGGLNVGYWTRDTSYVVPAVAPRILLIKYPEMQTHCAGADGCYGLVDGASTIWILDSLDPPLENCVISHEVMHYAGFRHDGGETPGIECAQGKR